MCFKQTGSKEKFFGAMAPLFLNARNKQGVTLRDKLKSNAYEGRMTPFGSRFRQSLFAKD